VLPFRLWVGLATNERLISEIRRRERTSENDKTYLGGLGWTSRGEQSSKYKARRRRRRMRRDWRRIRGINDWTLTLQLQIHRSNNNQESLGSFQTFPKFSDYSSLFWVPDQHVLPVALVLYAPGHPTWSNTIILLAAQILRMVRLA
jgi:hypothetical protein